MRDVTLRGTPEEMGKAYGAALRGLAPLPWDPGMDELALACEKEVLKSTPEYVVEMEATAEAAGIDPRIFKNFTMCAPLQQTLPSCSVVAVLPERSAEGKTLVGRNYDFDYAISLDSAETYFTYPAQGYAHIGNCDIWVGREDGLNEAGLFVAMSATFLPGVQPGLTFWFVVRALLERCATVEEAQRWIASVPHAQSRNFMLADANTALVVEASTEGVRTRTAEDGILVMTNHPIHPDWAGRAHFQPDDSQARFDRLVDLPTEKVQRHDLTRALNDRASGVCAFSRWEKSTYGTIWSIIACPEDRMLAIAPGAGENGTMNYRDLSAHLSQPSPAKTA